jgi:hypothetical protein
LNFFGTEGTAVVAILLVSIFFIMLTCEIKWLFIYISAKT